MTNVAKEAIQNLLEGKTLQEVVLALAMENTDAGTIMSLCQIGEDELAAILPRSMWVGIAFSTCPRCQGRGLMSRRVTWEQDELHRKPITD